MSRIGILSAGSRTAEKIRGMVTKLPDGIPPAPTLATRVVSMIMIWSRIAQLVTKGLCHEKDRRRLIEGRAVVVEVGPDARGQLTRSPRDTQPLERSQGDRNRGGGAGGADRVSHHVRENLARNRSGDIRARTHIWSRYQITWIASPPTTTTISQISEAKTRIPSFWPTLAATIPKTASGTRATTQSNTFIKSSKPIVSRSTTTLKRCFTAGLLAVADLHQADPQG